MSSKGKFLLLPLIAAMVCWGASASAQLDPAEPLDGPDDTVQIVFEDSYLTHTDELSGVTFTVTTDSASPKSLRGEADPVTLDPLFVEIEFHGDGLSTELVTVSGLLASTEYHLYRNQLDDHQAVMSDAQGSVSFYQSADAEHMILLQAAPSTVFIRDDTTGGNCNAWGTWYPATKTCELGMDVPDSIQVTDSNVTLDCLDHNVTNPGGLTNGIYVRPLLTGVKIRNCHVSDFVRGIYSRSPSTEIAGCSVTNATTQGIYLYQAPNSVIDDCTVTNAVHGVRISADSDNSVLKRSKINDSVSYGLYVSRSAGVKVGGLLEADGNTFNNSGTYGMYVVNSTDADVFNNVIDGTGNRGGYFNIGTGHEFSNNTVVNHGLQGVLMRDVDWGVVDSNEFLGDSWWQAIYFYGSDHGRSRNNTITNHNEGVTIFYAVDTTSTDDTMYMNTGYVQEYMNFWAARMVHSNSCALTRFRLFNSAPELYFEDPTIGGIIAENRLPEDDGIDTFNNRIENCIFDGVSAGISFMGSNNYDNIVENNTVRLSLTQFHGGTCSVPEYDPYCYTIGLTTWAGPTNNIIRNNRFYGAMEYGIATNNDSSGNQIYNNSFTVQLDYIMPYPFYENLAPPGTDPLILNTNLTAGTNIMGGPFLGGNAWSREDHTGFSQTCTDADGDRICDDPLVLDSYGSVDNYPLTDPPTVGDVVVNVDGDSALLSYSTDNGDGTTTVTVEETDTTQLNEFSVTFPAGTLPPDGLDEIDMVTLGGNKPGIVINAVLPEGTTKDVTLSRGVSNLVCVDDRSDAYFSTLPGGCLGDKFSLPAWGSCQTLSVDGDPGDGLHDVELCVSADGATVSLSGLLHTAVYMLNDDDGDGFTDEQDLCPGTDLGGPVPTQALRNNHLGDDVALLGCNASQILECKPGNNNGEHKFGITPGTQDVFLSNGGWASQCW
jgi:parallel beta-helix repeat protein